jgi:hypothetical protein
MPTTQLSSKFIELTEQDIKDVKRYCSYGIAKGRGKYTWQVHQLMYEKMTEDRDTNAAKWLQEHIDKQTTSTQNAKGEGSAQSVIEQLAQLTAEVIAKNES